MRFLLLLMLLPTWAHALTRTIANGGGNWNATGTWVEGAVPTSSDDVVATATSGQVTVNTTTAVCKTLNLTGYTNTMTWTASQILNVSGAVTFAGTLAGTGTLRLDTGGTITWNGKTFPGNLTFNSGSTWTMADNGIVTGTVTFATSPPTINGNTLTCNGSLSLTTTQESGTVALVMGGTGTLSSNSVNSFISSNLTINTAGTITLGSTFAYATGTFTYTAGTIVNTGNTFSIRGSCTLNTSGMNFNNFTCTTGGTITLSSVLNMTGTLAFTSAIMTIAGGFQTNCGNITMAGNSTTQTITADIVATGNLSVTGATTLSGAFNVKVAGNATLTSVALTSTTTTLVMNGTGTISSTDTGGTFNLPIAINTAAGPITFGSLFVTGSNVTLTITSGSIDITTNDTVVAPNFNFTIPYLSQTWRGFGSVASSKTITITADWTIPSKLILWGSVQSSSTLLTISGSFNVTCDKLVVGQNATLSFPSNKTLTVNTGIYTYGYPVGFSGASAIFPNSCTIKATTASTAFFLNYLGTPYIDQIFSATFTDVDASGSKQPVICYDCGTLTHTTNIYNRSLPEPKCCQE